MSQKSLDFAGDGRECMLGLLPSALNTMQPTHPPIRPRPSFLSSQRVVGFWSSKYFPLHLATARCGRRASTGATHMPPREPRPALSRADPLGAQEVCGGSGEAFRRLGRWSLCGTVAGRCAASDEMAPKLPCGRVESFFDMLSDSFWGRA